jgi:hypothetical protein
MFCADLSPTDLATDASYTGVLSYLASYVGSGYGDVTGDVGLAKANTLQTAITFEGEGFGDLNFKAHLHADSCANGGGGVRFLSAPACPLVSVGWRAYARDTERTRLLSHIHISVRGCGSIMCGIGRPVAHLLGALVAQHYNGGDGTTVDAVHENWPAASCSDGECAGWAGNDWLVPTADLKAGLSIGTPVSLFLRVAVPSIPACVVNVHSLS